MSLDRADEWFTECTVLLVITEGRGESRKVQLKDASMYFLSSCVSTILGKMHCVILELKRKRFAKWTISCTSRSFSARYQHRSPSRLGIEGLLMWSTFHPTGLNTFKWREMHFRSMCEIGLCSQMLILPKMMMQTKFSRVWLLLYHIDQLWISIIFKNCSKKACVWKA